MAISCDPGTLAEAAKCYCYDEETRKRVILYLLAVIAGKSDMTPAALAEAAKCYCFDPKTAQAVMLYLQCQIANL